MPRLLRRRVFVLDEEHPVEQDQNLLVVLLRQRKQGRCHHRERGVIRAFSRNLVRDRRLHRRVAVLAEEVVVVQRRNA